MRRRALWLLPLLLLVTIVIVAVVISRLTLRRHRVFRPAVDEIKVTAPSVLPPVEQWTEIFQRLEPDDLADLLERIEEKHSALYARYSLDYLHARALLEDNEPADAAEKLAPFLRAGHALRDLALYHQADLLAEGDDEAGASRVRQELIFSYPGAIYREQAIDDEIEYLAGLPEMAALNGFAEKIFPSASTERRREIGARVVEALVRRGQLAPARQRGFALLRGGATDDAADRVSRVLDRPAISNSLTSEELVLLGEAFRSHRHFDRATAYLTRAIAALPVARPEAGERRDDVARRDELRFALGRAYFGDEKYEEAQRAYLRGANATSDPRAKSQFLFHASRAAQLRGDDATAERLMTAAVAVPGTFPSTTAALTQRLRTRMKRNRVAEARSDFALIQRLAPRDRAVVDGALALAVPLIARGQNSVALPVLNSIPRALIEDFDGPEIAYWRGRAQESSDTRAAFNEYLRVLRAPVPTHFAYFARDRVDSPALKQKLAQELAMRSAQVTNLISAKNFAAAKNAQTDRILLSSDDRAAQLKRLAAIYRELPEYKAIMELKPEDFPRFPMQNPNDRTSLLMAMGLFDEATEEIEKRYPLRPARSALTRSLALNRGQAARDSIYAIEVMMRSVPSDFVPDLLPITVRQLLYPRYFYDFILEDSKRFEADPTLVLAIMREESRFDPRAKSAAAARGLLQFIITTARDIGRDVGLVDVDPEDLYDPRVIIRLGARYVSTLTKELDGDRYKAAAAYNAGPQQVALWSRLAPAAGDDFFLSSINFDETKNYVRKVMNSYRRYGEIYGGRGPQGGLRVEP